MEKCLQGSECEAIWGKNRDPPLALLEELSKRTQFAVFQVEMTLWLVDTLAVISKTQMDDFTLYLKGGTCIQHYLPYEKQRFSQDIDLAVVSSGNWRDKIKKVDAYLERLNVVLEKKGWVVGHGLIRSANPTEIKEFPFIRPIGRIFEAQKWPRLRSKLFGKSEEDELAFVKAEFFLHETSPDYHKESLHFEITNDLVQVSMNIATKSRLAADKIIAMAGGYGGRQSFKDVLDYEALQTAGGVNKETVGEFIVQWARTQLDNNGETAPIDPPVKVLHDALNGLDEQSNASPQALAIAMGNMYQRGRAGYFTELTQWKKTCKKVQDSLRQISRLSIFA